MLLLSCAQPMTAGLAPQMIAEHGEEAGKAMMEAGMAALCPLHRRMVSPQAMAGVICFLLSDAATDINGTNLPVDQVRAVYLLLCGVWSFQEFSLGFATRQPRRQLFDIVAGCTRAGVRRWRQRPDVSSR